MRRPQDWIDWCLIATGIAASAVLVAAIMQIITGH